MKHNVILFRLEELEGQIDRLDSLIVRMEKGDDLRENAEKDKSKSSVKSLSSFLIETPEIISNFSDQIHGLISRIENIIDDKKENKSGN